MASLSDKIMKRVYQATEMYLITFLEARSQDQGVGHIGFPY